MTQEHNGALAARRRRIVRCVLVLPPLLMAGAVFAHAHRGEGNRLAPLEVRRGAAMSWLVEHVAHMRLPDTRQVIDGGVEEAFRPVYASVPSFLDWYYSPRGLLTQAGWRVVEVFDDLWEWSKNLFGAENPSRGPNQSVDPVREEINERLFGGHAMRIAALEQDINSVLRGEVSAEIKAFLQREAASVLPEWRAEYRDMLQLVQDDIERRIDASVPPLAIGAVLTGTAAHVATAALSRVVARRMSSGMGARIARGLGRAAAPVTAAAGGLTVLVVGELVIGKVDEHLNRDDFERELIDFLDEESARIKAALEESLDMPMSETIRILCSFVPITNPDIDSMSSECLRDPDPGLSSSELGLPTLP